MILTLVREQLRAQRIAMIWTALVLAAAVGFSTYASVTGATHAAKDAYLVALSPDQAPRGAFVQLTDLGTADDGPGDTNIRATTTVLADELAQSNAVGSDAWATASAYSQAVSTASDSGTGTRSVPATVVATWGATPWDAIMSDGRAPLAGEVALPASMARDLNLGIGDSVQLEATSTSSPERIVATQTVSGLTYDLGSPQPWRGSPLYINAADAPILTYLNGLHGAASGSITAIVGWSSPDDAVATALPPAWDFPGSVDVMQTGSLAPWLVALTLTVGAVIMAFAVGRTQAAVRVQWTATARALGARRSHLLGAGAVEAAAFFVVAIVGVPLGYATAFGEHAVWRHSLAAAPPVGVNFPWWLLAALAGLALVLAVTSAAIPAVLATRTPPTAALKATAVTDEQELSRRVRVRPVGVGLVAVWILLLQPSSDPGIQAIKNLLGLAGAVLLIAFTGEMARRGSEAAGRRWQHSSRPWQVYAGTVLGGHPRQAAALASIHFFALFGVAGAIADHAEAGARALSWLFAGYGLHPLVSPYGVTVIAVLLAVAALCMAIIASSFRASAGERELAGALGLQPRDLMRAHAYTWAAAQGAGAMAGALAGTALVGSILASQAADDRWGFLSYELAGRLVAFGASVGVALVAGVLGVLLSVAVSAGSTRSANGASSRATRSVGATP